ncbi:MAG TPA: hypothetical protein VGF80_08570 [Galbitalea sp.]|jgi:uridine kinase
MSALLTIDGTRATPAALAAELRAAHPSGRVLVAVGGTDSRATAGFADFLALALRRHSKSVLRASASNFAVADRPGAAGRRVSYDVPLFASALLEPFAAGESFALIGSRADGDILFDPRWTSAPADSILVVDGEFLGHPALARLWDRVILTD